jgi:PIN domain nuclease of toxin-antitoxin system
LIYLDTHAVVWLYSGLQEKFSETGKELLSQDSLTTSPIVRLELTYLYELGKINEAASTILEDLLSRMGLQVSQLSFESVVKHAEKQTWTRDPFDRIIVAQASLDNSILLSKDRLIKKHYKLTQW